MVRLTIDNREVTVPPGATILTAARALGIDVPTLCHRDGVKPQTSCMICVVKLEDEERFVPSCATVVREGMRVACETDEVAEVRRVGLELLLSDHAGECRAPCQITCPGELDIARMMRHVAEGDWTAAVGVVRHDLALAAVLGHVCTAHCENACRRGRLDEPAAICAMKRHVALRDLLAPDAWIPPRGPASGKQVAIIGAGPTGLAAAWHLLQLGHACTLFERSAAAGGMLRRDAQSGALPAEVLDAEIRLIERLGATFRLNTDVGEGVPFEALSAEHDAVLLATGGKDGVSPAWASVRTTDGRVEVNSATYETSQTKIFAAGELVRGELTPVRAVREGKNVAICIDQALRDLPVLGMQKPFNISLGRVCGEELGACADENAPTRRVEPAAGEAVGFTDEEAMAEASRCLGCGCGKTGSCRLQQYAQRYGASSRTFRTGERRRLTRRLEHGEVIYDAGKCIVCGLCVQIARDAGEAWGLTHVGRGFDVRIATPFDCALSKSLEHAARACAQACPTGALALRPANALSRK